MRLTKELAEKYIAYRERYFSGSLGEYRGYSVDPASNSSDDLDPCTNGDNRRYTADNYVPFMITNGDPRTDIGTFLNMDRIKVDDGDNLELSDVNYLYFGDNTLYASIAMVNFAAEYAISNLFRLFQ